MFRVESPVRRQFPCDVKSPGVHNDKQVGEGKTDPSHDGAGSRRAWPYWRSMFDASHRPSPTDRPIVAPPQPSEQRNRGMGENSAIQKTGADHEAAGVTRQQLPIAGDRILPSSRSTTMTASEGSASSTKENVDDAKHERAQGASYSFPSRSTDIVDRKNHDEATERRKVSQRNTYSTKDESATNAPPRMSIARMEHKSKRSTSPQPAASGVDNLTFRSRNVRFDFFSETTSKQLHDTLSPTWETGLAHSHRQAALPTAAVRKRKISAGSHSTKGRVTEESQTTQALTAIARNEQLSWMTMSSKSAVQRKMPRNTTTTTATTTTRADSKCPSIGYYSLPTMYSSPEKPNIPDAMDSKSFFLAKMKQKNSSAKRHFQKPLSAPPSLKEPPQSVAARGSRDLHTHYLDNVERATGASHRRRVRHAHKGNGTKRKWSPEEMVEMYPFKKNSLDQQKGFVAPSEEYDEWVCSCDPCDLLARQTDSPLQRKPTSSEIIEIDSTPFHSLHGEKSTSKKQAKRQAKKNGEARLIYKTCRDKHERRRNGREILRTIPVRNESYFGVFGRTYLFQFSVLSMDSAIMLADFKLCINSDPDMTLEELRNIVSPFLGKGRYLTDQTAWEFFMLGSGMYVKRELESMLTFYEYLDENGLGRSVSLRIVNEFGPAVLHLERNEIMG